MHSIYILLTRTRTILSRTIHAAPGNDYTHAALSLDESFTRLYSFGRKYRYSYLPAGFVRESVEKGLLGSSQDAPCAVYKLEISDRKYTFLLLSVCVLRAGRIGCCGAGQNTLSDASGGSSGDSTGASGVLRECRAAARAWKQLDVLERITVKRKETASTCETVSILFDQIVLTAYWTSSARF